MLNPVVLDGMDDGLLRQRLLEKHHIEVGAGLGALKGKVVRVGLMGHNSTARNVDVFLAALDECTEAAAQPR